jgi:ABC-2 type transport system ATP-binding protein
LFPSSGKAWLFDKPYTDIRVKQDIGFLPENPYFYDYLKGEEILYFIGKLYGMNSVDLKKRIDYLLENVGLSQARHLPLHKYSKGMLQRIGLAQAVIHKPKLVILDEPLTGLDPIGRKEIRDFIFTLKDEGSTIFFSTHILSDAEMICDRVAILMKGKLAKTGKMTELLSPKVKTYEIVAANLTEEGKRALKQVSTRFVDEGTQVAASIEDESKVQTVMELIQKDKARLISLIPQRESLEEIFIQEVKGK